MRGHVISQSAPFASPSRLVAALAAALVAASAGCAEAEDTARFEVTDIDAPSEMAECFEEAFPLEPSFFAARESLETVGLLMQTKTRLGPDGDLVHVELFGPDEIDEQLGESIAVEHPSDTSSPARASVAMYQTCPRLDASLAVEGTIRFEEFGKDPGDRIVGELTDATIVDTRREQPVASMSGSWAFTVEGAPPHRLYPDGRDPFPEDL